MTDHTLDDILADTTAESTEVSALATLAAGIKMQLDQALSGATLSPAQQAKVNAIFANIEKNKEAIAAAIVANTASGEPAPSGGAQATSTTVASSSNPASVGAPVTLTGAVNSAGDPKSDKPITGSVQFLSDGVDLGSANVDSTGVAALSVTTVAAGDHQLTAVYSGDAAYATSTSEPLTQTIGSAPTA